MKLIGVLNGICALREIIEEYKPENSPPLQDMIKRVRAEFQFAQYPILQLGVQTPPASYAFAAGRFTHDDKVFSIDQLIMLQHGDVVAAGNTNQADFVLDHLINLLQMEFGYRLKGSTMKRSYLSSLVAEFSPSFEDMISQLTRMERAIDLYKNPLRESFKIKRLSFGDNAGPVTPPNDPIETIERADFIIERRVGHKFSENRYFCSAPMSTQNHIVALERIEEAIKR